MPSPKWTEICSPEVAVWVVSWSGTRPNDSANHRAASATLRKWLSFRLLCRSDDSSTIFPWFIIAALSIAIFSIACLKVVISSCLSAISTSVSASSTRRLSISSNKGCGATVLPRYTGIWAHFSNRTSLLPEVAVATWLLSLPARQARLSATCNNLV